MTTPKPDGRHQCPRCPKRYMRDQALVTHVNKVHGEVNLLEEAVLRGREASKRDHDRLVAEATRSPMTSVDEALKGANLVRGIAKRLRNANQDNREKLARELEALAFGFDFLYKDLQATDYWAVKAKADKWDKLVELLPIMETYMKELPSVRTDEV